MKILVVGKIASVTGWLEDSVAAWRADGHQVLVAASRNPGLHPTFEKLLLARTIGAPMAVRIARSMKRFAPDLIIVIGAFHVPPVVLEALATTPSRPPMIGWVGDLFDEGAADSGRLLDAVFYTDTGLLALHDLHGFASPAHYLPHAVNPHRQERRPGPRRASMVFVANPTEHRRMIVRGLRQPITLRGPGWTVEPGPAHDIVARRITKAELQDLYGEFLGALNIRNEHNVLSGLNQRNFDPCLAGTAVVSDRQPDLEKCFEPGREVLVYNDIDELNDVYERLLASPEHAIGIGRAGRARVLAEHTYARRLSTMRQLV